MFTRIWAITLIIVGVSGDDGMLQNCPNVMKQNGLTGRFPGAVAHGIHSITLDDIRYYFEPNARKENGIPTLNYNLTSDEVVLPNAQLFHHDNDFKTIGMRRLDLVLRSMDKKDWYLAKYNTLERLVHAMHMAEVWAKAKVYYDQLATAERDNTAKLCSCVMGTSYDDIVKVLHFMALKIRYPGFSAEKVLKLHKYSGIVNWDGNIYKFHFLNEMSEPLKKFHFSNNVEADLKRAKGVLTDNDEGIVHLYGEDEWKIWKSDMKKMNKHDDYELAVFLYCALRKQVMT